MANSANIIGKVVALQGQASVRSMDGSQHQLKLGDVIYENDIIITAANGRVELSFDEGRSYLLRESETVTLDSSVYAPTQTAIADAALLPDDAAAANVAQAIIGKSSLDQLLEETAAGLGGGEAGDGNGFVQLDRIAESVTPQSYTGGAGGETLVTANDGSIAVVAADITALPTAITVSSVSDPIASEGGNLDFTVSLSGASTTETTLNLIASSGSAILGTDTNSVQVSVDGGLTFVSLTASTMVPAGVTGVIVRIPAVNDVFSEGTETLTLSASTADNASPVLGTGSITDVAVPTLSISGVADANEDVGTLTYTVSLSAASAFPVSVNYSTLNGTAIAGSDYTATSGSLTFAPGELSKTITLSVINDTLYEGAENFQVVLSAPSNATISNASVRTTIHDDGVNGGGSGSNNDSPTVASVSNPSTGEGGNLDFIVTLSNASTTATAVNLTPASGSASLGTDTGLLQVSVDGGATFVGYTATISVPAGVTSFIVRMATLNDGVPEATETLTLGAATANNAGVITGTGSIIDSNNAPDARNDGIIAVTEDSPVSGNVLSNDSDPDGNAISVSQFNVAGIAGSFAAGSTAAIAGVGTLTIAANGDYTFTPALNYHGAVPLVTYAITDGLGGSDTATLTFANVTPVNDAPDAINDSVITTENIPVTVAVRSNDSDPDGDALTVSAVTSGANGTVTIDPVSGNPVYTPNANYVGTDSFTYTVSDGQGGFDTATVSVTVGPNANDKPVAVNDSFTTQEGIAINLLPGQLLVNDSDIDGDALSIASVQGAAHGTAAIVAGNVIFTPDANYNGPASFTYTISDGHGGTSTATVNINVTPVNDKPVAVNDNVSTAEDTPVTVDVRSNDSDPDGNALAVSAVTSGANGTVTIDPVSGNPVYTPNANYVGTDSFTYTVSDGQGGFDTATVSVTVGPNANDKPVAVNDSFTTEEGTAINLLPGQLLVNDSDIDGDALSIASVQGAVHGTAAIVAGNVIFTPDANYNGPASFTYTISDGHGGTSTATVNINVTPVNDKPVAVNDNVSTAEDTPVTVDVRSNDSDPDGNALAVSAVTSGANGTVTIDPVSGNPVYTPNANYVGTDSFTYTVSDGQGGFDTATVSVTVGPNVNDKPVAINDIDSVAINSTVTGNVLTNDSDVDGNTLVVTQFNVAGLAGDFAAGSTATIAGVGALSVGVNGDYSFTPLANYAGAIPVVTYIISDGQGGSDSATLTLTMGANTPPVAIDDGIIAVTEDTPVSGNVLSNDSDADGNAISVSQFSVAGIAGSFAAGSTAAIAGVGTLTIAANGDYTFTPALNYHGAVPFATYTITDGLGGSDTATLTFADVSPVIDVFTDDNETVTTPEDTALSGNLLTGTSSVEGPVILASFVVAGDITVFAAGQTAVIAGVGSLLINADGGYTFTPELNYYGAVPEVSYTMTDGYGADTSTLNIGVIPANDAPLVGDSAISLSEEGLAGGLADSTGNPADTTNLATRSGTISILDVDNVPQVTLTAPLASLTSGGVAVTWSGAGTSASPLIGIAGSVEVFRATIDSSGNYTVSLSKAIDHVSAGGEDVSTIHIGVSATDGSATATGNLAVAIEDDAPAAHTATRLVYVGVDTISVNNLDAGFVNDVYLNGSATVTRSNNDTDPAFDQLRWGTPTSGSGNSGYNLVDNSTYSSASGAVVEAGAVFKLGDFTHVNFSINANSSTLRYTDISSSMNVVINGVSTAATFAVRLTHTETPNTSDPVASRDIISLPTQTVTVQVGGQTYQVNMLGFKDAGGNLVNTIYSDENTSNNTFGIFASITSTDPLPQITGNVNAHAGADGMAGSIVWDSVASSYGTFVGNADGSYTFSMNRATRDALDAGQTLNQSFGYTVTDRDGDSSSASIDLQLGGYQNFSGSSGDNVITGTGANELLSGFAGNDTLNGGAGSDVLVGGAGNDLLIGDSGSDVLRWNFGDSGTDTVLGFGTAAGTDVLDLRDLLVGEWHSGNDVGNLASYLHFTTSNGNTTVTAGGQTIILESVDLTLGGTLNTDQAIIQDLLNKGKLFTD